MAENCFGFEILGEPSGAFTHPVDMKGTSLDKPSVVFETDDEKVSLHIASLEDKGRRQLAVHLIWAAADREDEDSGWLKHQVMVRADVCRPSGKERNPSRRTIVMTPLKDKYRIFID